MSLWTVEIPAATPLGATRSHQLVTFEAEEKSEGSRRNFPLCPTTFHCEAAALSVDFHPLPSPPVPKPPNAAFISFALSQPVLPAHTYQCHGSPPPIFLPLHVYENLGGEKILSTIASGRIQTAFSPHSNNFDKSKYPVAPTTKAGFTLAVRSAT